MHVLILAAGKAERLYPLCKNIPKTLLYLEEATILEHILENCLSCGLKEFSIVTGHGHSELTEFVKNLNKKIDINFIYNDAYSIKGNIHSYYQTKTIIGNHDHVIINSDTIFHKEILADLLSHPEKNVMAVDDIKDLSDEEMKILLNEKNQISRIHKSIDPQEAVGEYIGLMKIGQEFAPLIIKSFEETMAENPLLYYEDGFQRAIEQGLPMFMQSTKGRPCMEIDTHEDLANAKKMIKIMCP